MTQQEWQAEQFEDHRAHLRSVARRMLGSAAEADDAVQEAWLRLSRTETDDVANMRGWLTTVVSRICLDMLRARHARREELVDEWVLEPLVPPADERGPEGEAILSDSVGLAMLVVLETLSPGERLAFVLHDMFGMPFEEIAPVLERSVSATRQLASRARRRVRGAPEPQQPSLGAQRRVVEAFLQASRNGDFDALVAILDPDVVFHVRGVPAGPPVPAELHGADGVAELVLARGTPMAPFGRPALVNGRPGAVVAIEGRIVSVVTFTVERDRVIEMELVVSPTRVRDLRG